MVGRSSVSASSEAEIVVAMVILSVSWFGKRFSRISGVGSPRRPLRLGKRCVAKKAVLGDFVPEPARGHEAPGSLLRVELDLDHHEPLELAAVYVQLRDPVVEFRTVAGFLHECGDERPELVELLRRQ